MSSQADTFHYLIPKEVSTHDILLEIKILNNLLEFIVFKHRKDVDKIKFLTDPSDYEKKIISILDNYFYSNKIDNLDVWNILKLDSSNPFINSKFKRSILQTACSTRKGELLTYSDIGRKIHSKAYRAIGNVLRNNPYPILIPCHRIVSKSGIGGFMGKKEPDSWEIKVKQDLLSFEKR